LYNLSALLNHQPVRTALAIEERDLPRSLLALIEGWLSWKNRLPQLVTYLAEHHTDDEQVGTLNQGELRWLPPLMYPRKLICIGTNYRDHLAEMGVSKIPRYPYSFFKPATTTLVGSGETVWSPEKAKLIDWEAELAVIIGQKTRNVQGTEALNSVAGYSIVNDLSARDWIVDVPSVGIDWIMQKAFDGFAPMGPFFTPAEFVPDPQRLSIQLTVNGVVKQKSTTANMLFSVQEIIEHLSSIMTLEPGDVIATGTPAGVGFGKKPIEVLHSGDTMIVEIEGLGCLETPVV
jgi:2-keto-4-pentenoate hydratase/2-oxohepta-3-ene-1,7-dioic acid hydratase in catechol pathway